MNKQNLKIIQGEAINEMKKLKSESVDLIIADYPFNCQDGRKDYGDFIKETANEFYRLLKKDCVLVVINNPPNIFKTIYHYRKFVYRNGIALIRKGALRPAWHFGFQHNYCLIFCKGSDIRRKWNGTKKNHDKTFMTDVIEYQNGYRGKGKDWHPQAIPLDLIKKFIKIFSNEGDIILDSFLGSGTTAIACKELNRKLIGIEIKSEYIKMIKRRLNLEQTKLT